MKILIICTGNSCRSQMAEGYLRTLNPALEVYSAGIRPEDKVSPYAVRAMQEMNIDISHQHPKNSELFKNESFDYVITVCDNARIACPVFVGKVGKRLHVGLEDPAEATGTDAEKMVAYRHVRQQVFDYCSNFYNSIKDEL